MEGFSDAEWDDFDRFVESLGPLYAAEEEIVFRGEDIPIDLQYVRTPAHDARKAAELLENDPNLFSDAGLYTVLPIAKSVEMHLRLLYFGYDRVDFSSEFFKPSAAFKSVINWSKSDLNGKLCHTGMNKKLVEAKGEVFEQFANNISQGRKMKNKVWYLINMARAIYECGHKYRHNEIKDWNSVKPIFLEQSSSFDEFCIFFDKLTG
ncbi:hypothetical protein N9L22_02235 [Candidatus Poseidonia alphae]|nr:hypothetical protein [Candidatus Poseidonia alphae]MDB2568774.1 hypothetical protein [Candidatus Poseidonia alphae]